jgi:hypothetical protein
MRSELPAEGIPKMFIEPTKTYVSLSGDGTSKQFPGGAAFWSLLLRVNQDGKRDNQDGKF